MPVVVEKQYAISIDNSPQWKVPFAAIKAVDGEEFVKVTPYDQSFVKLLCFGCLELPKNAYKLSAAGLPGFKDIICLRNAVAFADVQDSGAPEELLFGRQVASDKKAKTPRVNAAKLKDMPSAPNVFEFEVPGVGSAPPLNVSMLRPVHPCDDLAVKLDEDTLEHVVAFIRDRGIEFDTLNTRRQYGQEEPGTWRMGSAGVVRKLDRDAETGDANAYKKKFKSVGAKKPSGSPPALGDSDGNLSAVPLHDA